MDENAYFFVEIPNIHWPPFIMCLEEILATL